MFVVIQKCEKNTFVRKLAGLLFGYSDFLFLHWLPDNLCQPPTMGISATVIGVKVAFVIYPSEFSFCFKKNQLISMLLNCSVTRPPRP